MSVRSALVVVLAAWGVSRVYGPLTTKLSAFGVWRLGQVPNIHGEVVKIAGTFQCEDLHYHPSSHQLFAACEDGNLNPPSRKGWFPPLDHLDTSFGVGRGQLVVIDPETLVSQRLKLDGFPGPFATHGIDVYEDPSDSNTVHIIAVNHLPHPEIKAGKELVRSQIEVFEHRIGSKSAQWIRSVLHPRIITPNDVLATSKSSFYVTNDHYYRKQLLRMLEDVAPEGFASFTDVVHIEFDPTKSGSDGVNATTALSKVQNANGLGRGAFEGEVLLGRASVGILTRTSRSANLEDKTLKAVEHIQIGTTIDNPFYYHDRYATPDDDASGYVLAGLTRALTLKQDAEDPSRRCAASVWHVKLDDSSLEAVDSSTRKSGTSWNKTLIFQDDGNILHTGTTAVLVGIDPTTNAGRKQARLFVTGVLADAMVATVVDL